MPLAGRDAGNVNSAEHLFAAFALVLARFDESLLLGVAGDFIFIRFPSNDDQPTLAVGRELQEVAFRVEAVAGTDMVDAPHHTRRVAWIQAHIDADFVVLPLVIAQNRVRQPIRLRQEIVRTGTTWCRHFPFPSGRSAISKAPEISAV